MCNFKLGKQLFSFEFIICRGLSRPCILGLNFLRKYKIGIVLSPGGKFQLDLHQQVLVESVKVYMSGPTLQTRQCINIPSRSLMFLNVKATIDKHMEGGLYKVVPNFLLSDEYPELVLIPTTHNVEKSSYRMQKFWINIRSLRNCVRNMKIYSQRILQT